MADAETINRMVERLLAIIVGIIGVVAAWFAFVGLRDEEVAERIDEAREDAEERNAAAWGAIEVEAGKITAEVEKIDDRSELAKMLDE